MMIRDRLMVIIGLLILASVIKAEQIRFGTALPLSACTSNSSLISALDSAFSAGASFVRIPVDWAEIEPQPQQCNFSPLDTTIREAHQRGLEIILVFTSPPGWTVTYLGKNPTAEEISRARPDLLAYQTFVKKVAARYRSRVTYYQTWERPTSKTLLAMPKDVIELNRFGAKAVHSVDKSLRVISAEPGDVDISWIELYLKTATGDERSDILFLSTIRPTMTSRDIALHIQTLHQRILTEQSPKLWFEVPVNTENMQSGLMLASMALFQGISDLAVVPMNGNASAVSAANNSLEFLSRLKGYSYKGWKELAPEVIAGVFSNTENSLLLAAPLKAGTLCLTPDAQTISQEALAAPGGVISVSKAQTPATLLPVKESTEFALAFQEPVLLSGISVTHSPGKPDTRPVPVAGDTALFDMTGNNRTAIHPMPELPGGHFSRFALADGREVLATLRDTNPWIYFDVPDGFLFYNVERIPVEVIVTVMGAHAREKVGFCFYYDSFEGMHTTPWKWIDVGTKNVFTYTFRLNDAIFAGREGYDLRLDMGGSESSVQLLDIKIKKLPPFADNSNGKR